MRPGGVLLALCLACSAAAAAPQPAADPGARSVTAGDVTRYLDLEIGLQSRLFRERGLHGQDRVEASVSARLDYRRAWDDDRHSLSIAPFVRIDSTDSERSRFDLREFYWSRVDRNWELHAGVRQVFWGVTEFNHLVDIVNQTDLVENIDGEDKLGQPMVQVSLVRDWGIVDLYLLAGFRERTFPGTDGRLRAPLPVAAGAAEYASGAERGRIDGAIRWAHYWGPLNFGLHHFSGTARSPQLQVATTPAGDGYLRPYYPVVERTGTDAQLLLGDWAFKLEALRQSGNRDRHHAATVGFERTRVGVLDSRADLGLVVEYMWDERGETAYDTFFENDLAIGTRWQFNDMQDTHVLIGVIRDLDTGETLVSLEGGRRIGASWELLLEGRWFGGADRLDAELPWPQLLQSRHKSAPLQHDDYLQLELIRYF